MKKDESTGRNLLEEFEAKDFHVPSNREMISCEFSGTSYPKEWADLMSENRVNLANQMIERAQKAARETGDK